MVGRAAGGGGGSRRALSGAASLGRVGFVGLGAMGGPMALNLGKAGLSSELLLFDADTEKTKELAGEIDGGVACGSLKEVAEGADVIVTMLPASVHVQAVYLDKKDGLLRHVNPGTLLIDSSTISPQVSQEVSAAAAKVRQGLPLLLHLFLLLLEYFSVESESECNITVRCAPATAQRLAAA